MSRSSRNTADPRDPPPPYKLVDEQTPLFQRQNEDLKQSIPQPRLSPQLKRRLIIIIPGALILAIVVWGISTLLETPTSPTPVSRIAIIGAGPAGVSTAFTLAQRFKDSEKVVVDITIFDKSLQVGGRMALDPGAEFGVQIYAEDVAGGCLGHNRVLRKRAKEQLGVSFGMNGKNVVGGRKDDVGFWDGKHSVRAGLVRPSGRIGAGLWIKLVWKYGASFWKARELPKGTMKRWESLVGLRTTKKEKVFEGVEDWVSEAGINGAVGMGAGKRLEKNGVKGNYVTDILRSEVRRHTGGELEELSDLALSMALEREDRGSCVDGQGGRMAEVLGQFLSKSQSKVRLGTEITGLKRDLIHEDEKAWILELTTPGQKETSYEVFDKVIIAAPWNTSSFMSTEEVETQEQIIYHSLWITFISSISKLDPSNFGSAAAHFSQILPIPSQHLSGIHEIAHLRDVYRLSPSYSLNNTSLYRVLSSSPPSLELWGDNIDKIYQEKIENAYPVLYPRTDGFGKFKIGEELWWTGAMEAVASEIDGAWVTGENVGELVIRDINGKL